MPRRQYGQPCSLASALDQIGERWSMLIVRELSLGPLRFAELARDVGGAPTDVLTKRLRDFEREGIVRRRDLAPPASAVAYELTELGRGLERPMLELARWGLNFQHVDDVVGLVPSSLPNALRVILRPPAETRLTIGLRSEGSSFALRIEDGWIDASRGEPEAPGLALSGAPFDVVASVVAGAATSVGEGLVEVEGDATALPRLCKMVALPERMEAEAQAMIGAAAPV
jgi:DNA-binding HxlR family transcriptional regulator